MTSPEKSTMWAQVRLSDVGDVPNIHRLIRQMAEFELLTHLLSATESSLSASLFPNPNPFRSVTVLILELSPTPIAIENPDPSLPFSPIVRRVEVDSPAAEDSEAAEFPSASGGGDRTVAGFVLCFPNYSTFMGRAGMYVEDLFVRAPWRRRGFGRMLLAAVAKQAAQMGMGRVEWCVLDWNENAIKFYQEMGAEVMPQWRICRLTGPQLQAYISDGDQ